MKEKIASFAAQLHDALRLGERFALRQPTGKVSHIAIAGMGGSGIGANLVRAALMDELTTPINILKGYGAPACVGPGTLFIACSYSGETEETLDALKVAWERKANVMCITSGGTMAQFAATRQLDTLLIPAGSSSPRAMVGYAIVSLLYVLHCWGLIGDSFVQETRQAIARLEREQDVIRQEAKKVAKAFRGKLPILYGDDRTEAIAIRFQNQLNENAKHFAHVNVFPEMNHNEIVGLEHPGCICAQMQVAYLLAEPTHLRIARRMEICRKLFEDRSGHPVIDIVARGDSLIERYFFLIHFTDWVSYFLAEENGEEAEPIAAIQYLKEQLKNPL